MAADGMTKEKFRDYIDSFNRDDYAGFGKYYAEDVLLDLGGRMEIRGRDGILDFYRGVKKRVRETLTINNVLVDGNVLAAEIATEFYGLEDWPDFIAGPLMKGDAINLISFIFYTINDHGQYQVIRTARYKKF
jgi:SnoaL-like domain